jgi:signal peptidase I
MSATNDSELLAPPQTPPSEEPQRNPKWIGPIMAWFLPGSAHFLAGQRRTGLLWLLAFFLLPIPFILSLSLPGVLFLCAMVFFFVGSVLVFIALLVSSWRPTRRLGCFGWLLFIGAVLLWEMIADRYVLFVTTYTKSHIAEAFVMNGMSMAPTLISPSESAPEVKRPDRVFVNKWIYRRSDPKRGDIVIFKVTNPLDNSPTIWTQRVVGLPGETVDIESPYVLINGKRLTEPPIFAQISAKENGFTGYCTTHEAGLGEGVSLPLTLGSDEYFLMGDNSPRSLDSRFLGPVLRRNITGRIIRIYYPFDRIRELE